MTPKIQDILIIGGGPAGLSAALGLARQLITAVVFDSGVYRNARATHMHNVLGWDHRNPAELRAAARNDITKRYESITFEDTELNSVEKTKQGLFKAIDANGKEWYGRKVMLATGVKDVYPNIEGYSDCWARGVFHCLFCHGFEERGAPSAGVLAFSNMMTNPGMAVHAARMAMRLAKKITIYTNGAAEVTEAVKKDIEGTDFLIDTRPIRSFAMEGNGSNVIVSFEGTDETVTEGFVAHHPDVEINGPFVQQLSLELNPSGEIKTNPPFNETSVSGVFAGGDCATMMRAVPQAAAAGGMCAVGAVAQLSVGPAILEVDL